MSHEKNIDTALDLLRRVIPSDVLPPDLDGLETLAQLVPSLPPEVSYVYTNIGGTLRSGSLPFFLMTPIDVAATVRDFRALRKHDDSYPQQVARLGDGEKHLLLAHDNQSNYLGLHMRTPYASRVFTLDHAEPSTVPTFRSVASMLNAMADCVSRQVLRPDYPVLDARIANADDRRLSLDQLNLHLSDPDKKDYEAFAAMQLSHPDDMELFCELLDSGDMWIAERMCAIVGGRRYRPAIQRMVEAAATRGGNRIVATIAALRDWPIKEARDALRTLRDRVDEGYRAYFPQT